MERTKIITDSKIALYKLTGFFAQLGMQGKAKTVIGAYTPCGGLNQRDWAQIKLHLITDNSSLLLVLFIIIYYYCYFFFFFSR